ncbi:MAG: BatA and WFA domain-containing protein [Planctomycetes bacterium]|nr:BatA and WFA domain-containing protein [Planctomycetota bacterium]
MNFQYPEAFWGLLLIPLIILLRLWRMRPVTLIVPSIFIWRRMDETIAQRRVSSWKKVTLIMILQCLGVGGLVLALSQPARVSWEKVSQNVIILIDNSASLKTSGRWNKLIKAVNTSLNGLENDSRVAIFTGSSGFSDLVSKQTPPAAREHLKNLQPTDAPEDLLGLITRAAGLINRAPPQTTVYFVSDKKLPADLIDLLKIKPLFILQGAPSRNLAITHLAVTPVRDESLHDIFVRVQNFSSEEQKAVLTIKADDQMIASREVKMSGQTKRSLIFHQTNLLKGRPGKSLPLIIKVHIGIKLEPHESPIYPYGDELGSDNTVWLSRLVNPEVKVCLTGPDNPLLLKVLQSIPGAQVEYFPAPKDIKKLNHDLFIYNNVLPAGPISGTNTVLVNPAADFGPFRIMGDLKDPAVTYQNFDSPFLPYVDFKNINIWHARETEILPSEKEYWQSFISAGEFPLIGQWKRSGGPELADSTRLLVINFDLNWRGSGNSATNWPLDISFPVFWMNLVNELTGRQNRTDQYGYYRTGQPVVINLRNIKGAIGKRVMTLLRPGGQPETIKVVNQTVSFVPLMVGVAELKGGAAPYQIAVNLCDEAESDNNGQTFLSEAAPLSELQEKLFVVTSQSLTPWLVIGGLIFLMLAWWLERSEL